MDVSVIVPTRNRRTLLAMTLRSVLRQRDVGFEVIVVDEGSTDDTAEFLAALDDPRVRVIRHDDALGLSAARNRGAAEARGDWLAFIDDDDLWAPDKLARQLRAAEDAGCDWVYTGAVNIEGQRIVHSRPPLPPEETVAMLPRYNAIPGGGSNVVWRRTTWATVGPFDTRFRGGEDWDMSIRLARHGPPAWVCHPFVAKRVHSTNMFLDVAEIVRATKLIEASHGTSADWARHHLWFAERYMRNGRWSPAIGELVKAAAKGQLAAAVHALNAMLRRRFGHIPSRDIHSTVRGRSVERGGRSVAARVQRLPSVNPSGTRVSTRSRSQ